KEGRSAGSAYGGPLGHLGDWVAPDTISDHPDAYEAYLTAAFESLAGSDSPPPELAALLEVGLATKGEKDATRKLRSHARRNLRGAGLGGDLASGYRPERSGINHVTGRHGELSPDLRTPEQPEVERLISKMRKACLCLRDLKAPTDRQQEWFFGE
ncbi:MAG TPA: hypothetical protein VHP33_23480, partial [Polyangiaceae bacterium]|nr:hypothetical protein [Polyangiaceae bacterium]